MRTRNAVKPVRAMRRRPHELIWFFVTPSGTLVSDYGRTMLGAKSRLYSILNLPFGSLELVPSPVETGRTAWEVGL